MLKAYYDIPATLLDQISYLFLKQSLTKQTFMTSKFNEEMNTRLTSLLNQAKDQFIDHEEEELELETINALASSAPITSINQNVTTSSISMDQLQKTTSAIQITHHFPKPTMLETTTNASSKMDDFEISLIESITNAVNRNLDNRLGKYDTQIKNLTSKIINKDQPSILEGNLSDLKKGIRSKLSKANKFRQHSNNFKMHAKLNSVPLQLDLSRFPEPLFKHDQEFVDQFDQLLTGFQSSIITFITDYIETKVHDLETDLLADKGTLNLHTNNTKESDKIFRDLVTEIEHSHKKQSDSSFQKTLRRASSTIDSRVTNTPKKYKRKQASDSPEEVPAPNIPHYHFTAPTAKYSFGSNPAYNITSNYSYASTPAQPSNSNNSYASTPASTYKPTSDHSYAPTPATSRLNNYQHERKHQNYNSRNFSRNNENYSANYQHQRTVTPRDKHPFRDIVRKPDLR